MAELKTVVVYNPDMLWHLASGTKVRELGSLGRLFTADARTPGRLWYGTKPEHQAPIHSIELPVEVFLRVHPS